MAETERQRRERWHREAWAYEAAAADLERLLAGPRGVVSVEELDDEAERAYMRAWMVGVRARLGYVPGDDDDPHHEAGGGASP
jgi:hypothetical protein